MLQSIFTVYDEKAKAHLTPFFMHNSQLAERAFIDCINNDQHKFYRHPQDYTLFVHGTFDDEKAEFTLQFAPKPLGNGVEFIQVSTNEKIRETEVSDEPPLRYDTKSKHSAELI